jgi:DNA invertase Pin-like site-specific DNA recombinase
MTNPQTAATHWMRRKPELIRRGTRPSGDAHWTRARPELLPSWKKLKPDQRAELTRRFLAGESESALARDYRIGRTTVWRYLRAQGLVKIKGVSSVPHFTVRGA